ncbi:MAG: hypothetical protein GOMPHAMPRED_000811 [Gomphillus americanus]|uniref:RRM domain-containing protein n=1 Tax=Gomphillus americanus TaxID=1940652 RepID=A0A8H3F014_9LECA|nr:MAG: hypothetical protein GOMPHAMPRED_000811 [Gomphillus americanus]
MPPASRSRSRGRSRSPPGLPARSRSPRRSNSPRRSSRTPSDRNNHNGDRRSRSLSSARGRNDSRGSGRARRRSHDRRTRSRSRSASVDEQALKSTKIVVEKLTKNVNHGHLEEIFGKYGTIRDVDLPMNRHFNTNRGTAYIVFTDSEGAESAIAHMHEAQLDGAIINVSIVLSRKRFYQSPPPARRQPAPAYMDKPQSASYRDRGPPASQYAGNSGRYRSPPRRRSPPPPSTRSFGGRGRPDDRAGTYHRNRKEDEGVQAIVHMAVIREAGVEIEGIPAEIGTEDAGENIGKQKGR